MRERRMVVWRMAVGPMVVGVAVMGLALAVVAGCGGGEAVEGPEATVTETAAADGVGSGRSVLVPDRVTVYRPGLVDLDPAEVDVPVWPGPDPAEFLQPNPPRGEKGELTGEQVLLAYLAALDNADALWNVDGTVQWLVINSLPEGTAGHAGSVREAEIQLELREQAALREVQTGH